MKKKNPRNQNLQDLPHHPEADAMTEQKFDQYKYINDWKKKNMKKVSCSYKAEFVEEFREACKILDLKQSDIIREAMKKTIDQANKKNPQS